MTPAERSDRYIGRSLRAWRRLNSIKQRALAAEIGVVRETWTMIEQGRRALRLREFVQLAALFPSVVDAPCDTCLTSHADDCPDCDDTRRAFPFYAHGHLGRANNTREAARRQFLALPVDTQLAVIEGAIASEGGER